jgi:membrane protein
MSISLFILAILVFWFIYLLIINSSAFIIKWFIIFSKKLLFSQLDFIIIFIFSILVLQFNLYISMDISSEIITVFVFLPTVFFYNTEKEKNFILISSIKITLLIIFIKIFYSGEITFNNDSSSYLNLLILLFIYSKSIVFSSLYMEILKVLAIVLRYLKH